MSHFTSLIPNFITIVEDPSIPSDKVVCRDCGTQIPASLSEMAQHQQNKSTPKHNNHEETVADFLQKW